jgi:hypothetical protein
MVVAADLKHMEQINHKYFTLHVNTVKHLFYVSAFYIFHNFINSFCKDGHLAVMNPDLEVRSSQQYNAALCTLLLDLTSGSGFAAGQEV